MHRASLGPSGALRTVDMSTERESRLAGSLPLQASTWLALIANVSAEEVTVFGIPTSLCSRSTAEGDGGGDAALPFDSVHHGTGLRACLGGSANEFAATSLTFSRDTETWDSMILASELAIVFDGLRFLDLLAPSDEKREIRDGFLLHP